VLGAGTVERDPDFIASDSVARPRRGPRGASRRRRARRRRARSGPRRTRARPWVV